MKCTQQGGVVRSCDSDLKPIVPQEHLQTIDICRSYSYEGVVGWHEGFQPLKRLHVTIGSMRPQCRR
ncbi:hypothetical protein RUM43_009440, partial [Polyplax serrata]